MNNVSQTDFVSNGKIRDSQRHGVWRIRDRTELLRFEGTFRNGFIDGYARVLVRKRRTQKVRWIFKRWGAGSVGFLQ